MAHQAHEEILTSQWSWWWDAADSRQLELTPWTLENRTSHCLALQAASLIDTLPIEASSLLTSAISADKQCIPALLLLRLLRRANLNLRPSGDEIVVDDDARLLGACKNSFLVSRERARLFFDTVASGDRVDTCQPCLLVARGVFHNYVVLRPEEVFSCYSAAVQKDYPAGYFSLAVCYSQGRGGVPCESKEEAVRLYKIAADREYVLAIFNLAYCYDNGLGVKEDKRKAVHLYQIAATRGHGSAMVNLACFYEYGAGEFERDYATALKWYRRAASQGNSGGQFNLAWCLHEMETVDKEEVVRLYRLSADQQNTNAIYNLACAYLTGDIVAKDHKMALKLLEEASRLDHTVAQYRVALMCQDTDVEKATSFLEKAASLGYEPAREKLKKEMFQNVLARFDSRRKEATVFAACLHPRCGCGEDCYASVLPPEIVKQVCSFL